MQHGKGTESVNIIEALKTGKSLRRPIPKYLQACRTGWLGNAYVRDYLTRNSPWHFESQFNLITEVDLMADDWEVQP